MPVFRCDRATSLGRFLRGRLVPLQGDPCFMQRWRVLELLRSHPGSILVRSGGVSAAARGEEHRLRPGDVVSVNLERLRLPPSPERYHDYGIVPRSPEEREGRADQYADRARTFLDNRPQTYRLDSDAIDLLARDLLSSDQIVDPIRDVIVVAHSSAYGDLGIPLRSDSEDAWTRFEALQELIDEQAGSEQLRDRFYVRRDLVDPRPTGAGPPGAGAGGPSPEAGLPGGPPRPASLHIRGCNIGQPVFRPVLERLKQALGNTLSITAPKYFHYVGLMPAPNPGSFEWLAYGFRLLRRQPFDGDGVPQRRTQLVAAFSEEARREGSTIRYYDGSAVDSSFWSTAIPGNLDPNHPVSGRSGNFQERVWDMSVETPVGSRNLPARFWYRRWQDEWAFTWRIAIDPALRDDRPRMMEALRESLRDTDRTIVFQDDHPLPAYRRYGYDTFDAFLGGWEWEFLPTGAHEVTATGTRHEYKLIVPITNRTSAQLVLNFYPSTPGQESVLRLTDTEPFFCEV